MNTLNQEIADTQLQFRTWQTAPKQNFSGFYGLMKWIWTNGHIDGYNYDYYSGEAYGLAPLGGTIPVGLNNLGSGIKLFGSLTEKFGSGYKSVSAARGAYVNIKYGQNLNSASKGVWQKVYEAGYLNGNKVEVHYFYNSTNGQYANPFIKMARWGSKYFKD